MENNQALALAEKALQKEEITLHKLMGKQTETRHTEEA